MRKQGLWRYSRIVLFAVAITIGGAGTALAQTSSSNNYQVTETEFGNTQESCSARYCAETSIGDISNGNTMFTNTASFEDITDNEPLLEVIIAPGQSDLGVLTTERTASKITTVQVRSYLSGGYTLQIIGEPPKFGNHTLATSSNPVESKPGTEQFGINAVANTTPVVGANPIQTPSDQMMFGVIDDLYNTPNFFKYTSEDVVAKGVTDSGRTDYTISMIVNISNSTPAGHYSGDFTAVVIPAY